MLTVSCDQAHTRMSQVHPSPDIMVKDRETGLYFKKCYGHDERLEQLQAIEVAFSRHTDPQRAKYLAEICYRETLGTVFTPLDLAEIALTETGGFHLSNHAVSCKGAMGVWQLMPVRAKSHGYSPRDMLNDEKCAEAAVKELQTKLRMAHGDKIRAKKLYCGVGREADAYEIKRRKYRVEILDTIDVPVAATAVSQLQSAS